MKAGKSSPFAVFLVPAAALVLAGAIGGCRLNGPASPAVIIVHSDSLELKWDVPEVDGSGVDPPVIAYRIYYRRHGSGGWRLLDIVTAAPKPRYLVRHADVGNGYFDFAVSAVREQIGESTLHSSLDFGAQPVGGWYLLWEYPG